TQPPTTSAILHLRYAGTDTSLAVSWTGDAAAAKSEFEALHRARFGFISPEKAVVIETAEVTGQDEATHGIEPRHPTSARDATPTEHRPLYSGGQWHQAAIHRRADLSPGT